MREETCGSKAGFCFFGLRYAGQSLFSTMRRSGPFDELRVNSVPTFALSTPKGYDGQDRSKPSLYLG